METKICPYCAEEIKIEAIKCKHCGEFLKDESLPESKKEGIWICKKCKEEVEDEYDVCWNCGANFEGYIDKEAETELSKIKKEVGKLETNKVLSNSTQLKRTLGGIILLISIIFGVYGILLATGESAKYYSWTAPLSEYEIKTIIFIGIGILGSIGGGVLIGSNDRKK